MAALCCTALTNAQNIPSYVPTNGLVGWWPFNGNANDESGNGNNGIASGNLAFHSHNLGRHGCIEMIGDTNTTPTNAQGEPIYVNGGHMRFPDLSGQVTNAISINLWIRCLDSFPREYPLFFGLDNSGQNRLIFDYFNGFEIGNDNPSARINQPFANSISQWKMLTLCYAPGSLKAFINGQLVGADDKTIYSIPLNNGAINWHIWWNGTASRGHSIYDDIGIWNRALTQQEITNLYNASNISNPIVSAPNKMSYQAVVRNGSNALVTGQIVGMRISILQGSPTGTPVYVESQKPTTNANGLASMEIGTGTVVSGDFSAIDWASGPYFIKTETDPLGGSNYAISATSQLLSVPYALYAKTAGNNTPGPQGPVGPVGPQGPAGPGFSNGTANNQLMYWNGSAWVTLNPGTQHQTLTVCDGALTWTNGGQCPGKVASLDCGGAMHSGTLYNGIAAANNVSSTIAYTAGNGGVYDAISIFSTGVNGLTASLSAGKLADGSGSLTFTISGTPSSSGTANFAVNFGGVNCSFSRNVDTLAVGIYPANTVHCGGVATAVVNVINPATGRIWMDRNLGASRAATSSTDADAYGDLYQWGRRADGHQCRNSGTTSTLSSTDQPAHGNFIINNTYTYDWRTVQNDNLWQGTAGVNNPCPLGFRLPTSSELDAERFTWSSNSTTGAFSSQLKLPMTGYRACSNGLIKNDNEAGGTIWSSTLLGPQAAYLGFDSISASLTSNFRAWGFSVRCIKD